MNANFTAVQSIRIKTTAAQVWRALTDPALIKRYLFGTSVVTDWQAGSPITYAGVWEGKTYEDKGIILEVSPGKRLVSTYWSSMSGTPDKPENYATVAYDIQPDGEFTTLTVTQDNNKDEASRDHSQKNWGMVLSTIQKLLESE